MNIRSKKLIKVLKLNMLMDYFNFFKKLYLKMFNKIILWAANQRLEN